MSDQDRESAPLSEPAPASERASEATPSRARNRGRLALARRAGLTAAAGGLARFTTVAPDDDMAPTLLAGDLVLLAPGTPRQGYAVALVNPLNPSRWTVRRVETVGGQTRVEDGVFYTGNRVDLLVEKGRDDTFVTRREGTHLVRRSTRMPRVEQDPVTIPDDSAFLGVDARDEAMDSRWWGPIPLAALQARVLLNVSPPRHPWQGWVE